MEIDTNGDYLSSKNGGWIDVGPLGNVIFKSKFQKISEIGIYFKLTFSERCTIDKSIGIGGDHPPENMALNKLELNRLIGKRVTFNSLRGNIHSWGLKQPADHMAFISEEVYIITDGIGQNITFANESSVFRQLWVETDGHIKIETDIDIATVEGHLGFSFYNGDMFIQQYVKLSATGGNVITESKTGEMRIQMPAEIISTDMNIMIDRPIIVYRHGYPSWFNLTAFNSLTMKNSVKLVDNPMAYFHDKSVIKIAAGQIDLQNTFTLEVNSSSDEVWLHPTCYGASCTMLFGEFNDPDYQFHLTNDELNRITSKGILRIGDRTNTTRIGAILFNGITYSSSDEGTFILAHDTTVTSIFNIPYMY